MADRLRIFISAGPDLETEREVVGKAIATLPVSIGWIIKYTPTHGECADPAMEAVAACDFYALLLGRDVTAPMGSELYVARQTGKRIMAFVGEVPHTPAARVFLRESAQHWTEFQNADDLGPLLQKALMEQILQLPDAYRMTVADWEALSALSAELEEEASRQRNREDAPSGGGAGGDAVIVAPGRDLPSEGVLIEKPRRDS
jgi:hypothetical protein